MFFKALKDKFFSRKNFFCRVSIFIFESCKIFNERQGSMLSSSATFYFILTIVPLSLLILRLMGIFFVDVISVFESLFNLGLKFFPDIAPQMLLKVKDLVRSALFAKKGYTIINMGILFWSSVAFFNSIWQGISVIGKSPLLSSHTEFSVAENSNMMSVTQFKMYLRGIFIIFFSVILLSVILVTPPLLQGLLKFVQTNPLIQMMVESFPALKELLGPLLRFKLSKNFFVKSDIASFLVFFLYLTFIYRWIFSFRLKKVEAVISVLVFLGGVFGARQVFWLYLRYVREGLVRNYGDYYTIILGLVWIYFVMSLFYFSMCVAQVFIEKKFQSKDNQQIVPL